MTIEFSTELKQAIGQMVGEEMVRLMKGQGVNSIGQIEEAVRQWLHGIGQASLAVALASWEERYVQANQPCPACGGEAAYQRRREAQTLTVFGWVPYRRAYYLCGQCHQGHCPLDKQLGMEPGAVSAGLSPLLALLGIQTSFAESSEKLAAELLLLDISDNTIRSQTQQMGQLQAELEAEQEQACQQVNVIRERAQTSQEQPKRLYGSLDGVLVPIGQEWRELKAGVWYEVEENTTSRLAHPVGQQVGLRATNLTYYCDLCPASDLAAALWRSGYQRLAHLADEVVFVADGAVWIWNLVTAIFPKATQIVDWYHAAEYLPPIAHAAFADPAQQANWLADRRQELWDGRIDPLITACERLQFHPTAGSHASAAATYFFNNKSRMDYARFRAAGYQIGSGPMESGCKQIATLRLKRPGARWSEQGARLTAKARAAWLSGQWHTLKQRRQHLAHLPLAV